MKLSTKSRYGLRALCHIAHRGYATVPTIAAAQTIPARYLEEIIRELREAGFVDARSGADLVQHCIQESGTMVSRLVLPSGIDS